MRTKNFNRNTLPYLLLKKVCEYPQDMAYSFPEFRQDCSWAELWRKVSAAAKGYLGLGVSKGDTIAVLAQSRMETIVAVYAAACIGAVAVPLNTYSQKTEVVHYLMDAKPIVLILGTRGHRLHYPSMMREIMDEYRNGRGDSSWLPRHIYVLADAGAARDDPFPSFSELCESGETIEEQTFLAACRLVSIHDPLVLLYTSGTSGNPKGVLRSHILLMEINYHLLNWSPSEMTVEQEWLLLLLTFVECLALTAGFLMVRRAAFSRKGNHDRHTGAAGTRQDPEHQAAGM